MANLSSPQYNMNIIPRFPWAVMRRSHRVHHHRRNEEWLDPNEKKEAMSRSALLCCLVAVGIILAGLLFSAYHDCPLGLGMDNLIRPEPPRF